MRTRPFRSHLVLDASIARSGRYSVTVLRPLRHSDIRSLGNPRVMKLLMKRLARRLKAFPTSRSPHQDFLTEVGDWERELVAEVRPFTMTSPQRVIALTESVDYVVRRDVPGAFVECGVWRGGSILAMIRALQRSGVTDRDIYLYDTFEGMTEPSEADVSDFSKPASVEWRESARAGEKAWTDWFSDESFNLEMVRRLLLDTGYPRERLHFVQGAVEETIPGTLPTDIALLRLDTDWYESTRHEMIHLYPLLNTGGVLMIDDYGHWKGCRKAIDEYFDRGAAPHLLLNRVDYTCRIAVKAETVQPREARCDQVAP